MIKNNITLANTFSYLGDITTTFRFLNELECISYISAQLEILDSNLIDTPIGRDYSSKTYYDHLLAINLKLSIYIKYINKNTTSLLSLYDLEPIYKTVEIFLPKKLQNISTEEIIKKKDYLLEASIENIYFRLISSTSLLTSTLIDVSFKY